MNSWIVTLTRKDGSKRYRAYHRIEGKAKAKTFAKKKEARDHLTEVADKVKSGKYVALRPTAMDDVFTRWLEQSVAVRLNEGSLKPSTAKGYRSMVDEHFRPAFGKCRSDRFTLATVEDWRAKIAEQIKAGEVSPKFYVNLRNLLHAIAAWACHPRRGYLAQNPVEGLEKLHLSKSKKRPHFEPQQVAELLAEAAKTPPDDTIIRLAVLSGLRRGEVFALRWTDIEGGQIHVRQSVYQGDFGTPKTDESERVVDIPKVLLDDLEVYKVMHPPIGEEGFVFRRSDGRHLDPDEWHRNRLVPLLEKAGLRLPMTGLHSLRHTYVSLLAAQGEELRYIADQVGHASTTLTEQIYTHVFTRPAWRRCDGWTVRFRVAKK